MGPVGRPLLKEKWTCDGDELAWFVVASGEGTAAVEAGAILHEWGCLRSGFVVCGRTA